MVLNSFKSGIFSLKSTKSTDRLGILAQIVKTSDSLRPSDLPMCN